MGTNYNGPLGDGRLVSVSEQRKGITATCSRSVLSQRATAQRAAVRSLWCASQLDRSLSLLYIFLPTINAYDHQLLFAERGKRSQHEKQDRVL